MIFCLVLLPFKMRKYPSSRRTASCLVHGFCLFIDYYSSFKASFSAESSASDRVIPFPILL